MALRLGDEFKIDSGSEFFAVFRRGDVNLEGLEDTDMLDGEGGLRFSVSSKSFSSVGNLCS